MASDLDKKLEDVLGLYRREIERKHGGRTVGKTLTGPEAVEAIKQAFKDAGWSEPVTFYTPGVEPVPSQYMTGQE